MKITKLQNYKITKLQKWFHMFSQIAEITFRIDISCSKNKRLISNFLRIQAHLLSLSQVNLNTITDREMHYLIRTIILIWGNNIHLSATYLSMNYLYYVPYRSTPTKKKPFNQFSFLQTNLRFIHNHRHPFEILI